MGTCRKAALLRVLALVGAIGIARTAAASAAEVYGLGPASSAQAGAVSASVTDFSAVHYNPAGLVFSPETGVDLGFLAAGSGLEIQGRHVGLKNQAGPLVGTRALVPFGGFLKDRIGFGFALYVPATTELRIISRYPQEAFFPLFDNRSQRLIVMPGFGFRLHERLGLGIALNYFGSLSGSVQGAVGASRAIEPRADEHIGGRVGVNAGVRYDPWRFLSVALTYRQSFDTPFDVTSDVQVAGSPINLAVKSGGVYTPHELVFGAAYRRPRTTLGVDVTWAHWSAWGGPFIHVTSTLPLAGDLIGELPKVPFHDIVTVHVGGEHRLPLGRRFELALRGGYGYDPSPIPRRQPGVTNLMDGGKHLLALGLGGRLKKVGPATIRIDAHFGIQLVTERTYTKHIFGKDEEIVPFNGLRDEVKDSVLDPASRGLQISNPGYPSIKGGGFVWSSSVVLGVDL